VSLAALVVGLVAQLCGGLTPIFTKLALGGLPPWAMVAARQVLGVVVLAAIARRARGPRSERKDEPFSARDWGLLLCLAWAGFALPQVLLAFGISRSTGTAGALLSPLEPIGIIAGGALFLGERLTPVRVAAVALGTLGALMIVMQGEVAPGVGDFFGDVLIALGHLAWAIYTVAAKPLLERHDASRVSLWAVVLSLPPLVALASTETIEPARALPALGWVVALAVFSTALGTFTWNWALSRMSASAMALLVFVQPVVGLAAGRFALGEPVGALALAGAAVILVAVAVDTLRGGR
jgi:drug/metabolite transporter (DMT)-like permease